jgi:dihydrodiol dehydrogenase / D-xylose 1-dehydrogenase (NADP)
MSSELVLKWGIVSSGLISADFAMAVQSLQSKNHELVAVSARNINDAKKFAERFNMPLHFDSYERLFESDEINIVYVGSVNTTHKDVCLKAINAGKHVLCEKPMTINLQEQEEVLQASKKKGVFFMEALWTRFFPVIQKLKQEISNQTIGPQVNYFCGTFLAPIKDIERIKHKELGGGAILDIGIYPIQLACLVFNHEKPIKITCTGHMTPLGVDECCSITLLFPGQRIAQINISSNCNLYGAAYIAGEKGTIQIPEYAWCPTKMIMPDGTIYEEKLPECKTNYYNSVGLRFQAEAVRQAISNGLKEHSFAKHDDSRLIMSIMEEAKRQLGY